MTNEELDSTIQIPNCVKPKTKFFCSADKKGKGGVVASYYNAVADYSAPLGQMPVRLMLTGWVAVKPEKSGIWKSLRWAEFWLN